MPSKAEGSSGSAFWECNSIETEPTFLSQVMLKGTPFSGLKTELVNLTAMPDRTRDKTAKRQHHLCEDFMLGGFQNLVEKATEILTTKDGMDRWQRGKKKRERIFIHDGGCVLVLGPHQGAEQGVSLGAAAS